MGISKSDLSSYQFSWTNRTLKYSHDLVSHVLTKRRDPNRLGVPHGKRSKKNYKRGKVERFTVGFAIEYLGASMVGKCYQAFLFSFLQLKKFPPRTISSNRSSKYEILSDHIRNYNF